MRWRAAVVVARAAAIVRVLLVAAGGERRRGGAEGEVYSTLVGQAKITDTRRTQGYPDKLITLALFGAIGGPRPSADGLAFPTKTKTF